MCGPQHLYMGETRTTNEETSITAATGPKTRTPGKALGNLLSSPTLATFSLPLYPRSREHLLRFRTTRLWIGALAHGSIATQEPTCLVFPTKDARPRGQVHCGRVGHVHVGRSRDDRRTRNGQRYRHDDGHRVRWLIGVRGAWLVRVRGVHRVR